MQILQEREKAGNLRWIIPLSSVKKEEMSLLGGRSLKKRELSERDKGYKSFPE
jgi:hypothetical protein